MSRGDEGNQVPLDQSFEPAPLEQVTGLQLRCRSNQRGPVSDRFVAVRLDRAGHVCEDGQEPGFGSVYVEVVCAHGGLERRLVLSGIGKEEFCLVDEVAVEGPRRHVGSLTDVGHGDVGPGASGQKLPGGVCHAPARARDANLGSSHGPIVAEADSWLTATKHVELSADWPASGSRGLWRAEWNGTICHMTQTAIVIGGSAGLGLRAVRSLASQGWTVVATGRDLRLLDDLSRSLPGVVPVRLDLDRLGAVDEFAERLGGQSLPPVRALVGNAGLQLRRREWSRDGYELTVAVNYLAHIALIDRLSPMLARGARIVLTTSGTHDPDEVRGFPRALEQSDLLELVHPATPGTDAPVVDGLRRYATSKLCLVRAIPRLACDLHAMDISVVGFDPGLMPGTALVRSGPSLLRWTWRALSPLLLLTPGAHRVGTSARHLVKLVTSPRYEAMSGAYLVDGRPAGTSIASHDLLAGDRLYAATLDRIQARTLGRGTPYASWRRDAESTLATN